MRERKLVVVDARMLGQKGHGIAVYVEDLLLGLRRLEPSYELKALIAPGCVLPEGVTAIPVEAPFLSPAELWEIPRALKDAGASLYHSPSFSSLWRYPCPHIITAHDLNHLHYGSWDKKLYYQFLLGPALRSAAAVATVSQFSRAEISAWSGVAADKISVCENAVAVPEASGAPADGLTSGAFFLCISNPKPHKNTELLLRAYKAYRARANTPLPLAVTWELADAPAGVIALGALDKQKLWSTLRAAKAFFFPSLYEGFGRPPLEAALAGIPVTASDIPPHREALRHFPGLLRNLVDPADEAAWTESFLRAALGGSETSSAEERRQAQQHFSREKLAAAYDGIYRRILA